MSFENYNEVLSNREQQIAEKILEGLPNKRIASQLFISERTVKFHCHNIYKKLNIRSRHALVAGYYQQMASLQS
ncbi:LuxR C-terminal-related transcriptional regulator [Glaciecola sp. XM2]|uniref:response regulator transcription factor n=1 Tax=Glaciecola sp. XM2 TaxID=1914931 RepID=UPI002032EDE5|nr:LuxR C-terminal-related transcriptional regulator [Glaciecola sp. XM2]